MEIGYKQYLKNTQLVPNDGYFCHYNYRNFVDSEEIYCCEVNIINKILANEDGYFDFSKNMIDIGSDIGTYSFILPFNYFYMFEGNKQKCIIASFNMLIHNKDNQFIQYNTLLSDVNEEINYNGFETEYSNVDNFEDYFHVITPTSVLDTYNDINNVGFIKIDVEGMEEKVLRGSIQIIKNNNYPPILFELWPVGYHNMTEEKHQSLVNFFTELGYDIIWKYGQFDTHLAIHK